jgi:hypothetical protein
VDWEQTDSRNGRIAPSAWFLSSRNQSDSVKQKNQNDKGGNTFEAGIKGSRRTRKKKDFAHAK